MKRYVISLGFETSRMMSQVELAFLLEHLKSAVHEAGEVIDQSEQATHENADHR